MSLIRLFLNCFLCKLQKISIRKKVNLIHIMCSLNYFLKLLGNSKWEWKLKKNEWINKVIDMLFLYDEEKIQTRFMLCTTRLLMYYLCMYLVNIYLNSAGCFNMIFQLMLRWNNLSKTHNKNKIKEGDIRSNSSDLDGSGHIKYDMGICALKCITCWTKQPIGSNSSKFCRKIYSTVSTAVAVVHDDIGIMNWQKYMQYSKMWNVIVK